MAAKYRYFYKITSLSLIFTVLASCHHVSNKSKKAPETEPKSLYENFIEVENSGVNYKIPSPMEMFIFIEKTDAPFVLNDLHNFENVDNYPSRKSQAINFGIYSADLAYCAVFGDYQATLNYFDAAQKLAEKLGLHEGYGEKIATRIDNNLNNIDSLMEIAADSYSQANQFLESQGQSDILGLILVGGWIEGLYVTIESVGKLDINNPLIERIADQQVLLENLMGYLNNQEPTKAVEEVKKDLEPIQDAFDELYFNDDNTIITQKEFVDISNEVMSLRNIYINN